MVSFREFVESFKLPDREFKPTETQINMFDMMEVSDNTYSVWRRCEGVTTAILIRIMYDALILKKHCIYVTTAPVNEILRLQRHFKKLCDINFGSEIASTLVTSTNSIKIGEKTVVTFDGDIYAVHRGIDWDTLYLDLLQAPDDSRSWEINQRRVRLRGIKSTHIVYHL